MFTPSFPSVRKAVMGSGCGTIIPSVTAALVKSAGLCGLIWWEVLRCQGVITKKTARAEFRKCIILKANSDCFKKAVYSGCFVLAVFSIFKLWHFLTKILQGFRLVLKAGLPTFLVTGQARWCFTTVKQKHFLPGFQYPFCSCRLSGNVITYDMTYLIFN